LNLHAAKNTTDVSKVPKSSKDSVSSAHLGGLRLKHELFNTDFMIPEHDEHQEFERIPRLDKHGDDPTEHHSEVRIFIPTTSAMSW
jgi:hypothetical protein